jgi:hypothetical protein
MVMFGLNRNGVLLLLGLAVMSLFLSSLEPIPAVCSDGQGSYDWTLMLGSGGGFLQGVWGSCASDVFAVGDTGTILHYDGSAWSAMDSGTTNQLNDVWGTSASDVFAIGRDGLIVHCDGYAWSAMGSGTTNQLNDVWGSSSSDVFAVGDTGTILHYDGGKWSPMNSGTEYGICGIWGCAPDDVFAVGNNGTILHYNGRTWSPMNSAANYDLSSVWCSSGSDVWAVAFFPGSILHYDGAKWEVQSSVRYDHYSRVWGRSACEVFILGSMQWGVGPNYLYFDGTRWNGRSIPAYSLGVQLASLEGIWACSNGEVFAVGAQGTILHYSGEAPVACNQPPNRPNGVSPANGTTVVRQTLSLECSGFSDSDDGDTHAASQWQVTSTADNYANPLFDSGADAINLTSIRLPSDKLDGSTTYYWHARHQDNEGTWSSWSPEMAFTTTSKEGFPFWVWILVGVATVLAVGVLAYLVGRRRTAMP